MTAVREKRMEMCPTLKHNALTFKSYRFPLYNPRKLKKWLSNMKLKDWNPNRFSVLCINHFEEQHIDRTGKCVKLREDAVPTIFSSPGKTQKREVCWWLLSVVK